MQSSRLRRRIFFFLLSLIMQWPCSLTLFSIILLNLLSFPRGKTCISWMYDPRLIAEVTRHPKHAQFICKPLTSLWEWNQFYCLFCFVLFFYLSWNNRSDVRRSVSLSLCWDIRHSVWMSLLLLLTFLLKCVVLLDPRLFGCQIRTVFRWLMFKPSSLWIFLEPFWDVCGFWKHIYTCGASVTHC